MEQNTEVLRQSPGLFSHKVIVLILIPVLLLFVVGPRFLQQNLCQNWKCLDDLISVEIVRSDGDTEFYDGNVFPITNRGDQITVTIPLPEERRVENAALCVNIFHTTLDVYYGEELLFSHGHKHAAEGRFIGNTFQRIPLRDEMWGGEVILKLVGTEDNGCSTIQNVQIIPQLESHRYFYAQYQTTVLLFSFIMALAIIVFLVLLLAVGYPLRRQGIYLCLFAFFVPLWYLTSRGFTFVLTDHVDLAAHVEYAAMYLLPIPFCLFMYTLHNTSRFHKNFAKALSIVYSVLFVVLTVLNYTTSVHYLTFLLPTQIFMLIGMSIFIVSLMRQAYRNDPAMRVIRYGVCLSVFILILEILRVNLIRFALVHTLTLKLTFTPAAMIIFIGALAASYTMQLLDLQSKEADKAILRRLAYVDIMTGMSNRTYCYEKIAEMEKAGEKYFALLFFDVNGLKEANDNYGHEMGDQFIQCVATALQNTFGNQKFCARWGGDEFVVCLTGKSVNFVDDMLHQFDAEIQQVNQSDQFPFTVSVAYGVVRSSEEQTYTLNDAIKEADRRMYTAKLQMTK